MVAANVAEMTDADVIERLQTSSYRFRRTRIDRGTEGATANANPAAIAKLGRRLAESRTPTRGSRARRGAERIQRFPMIPAPKAQSRISPAT